jgi:TM2 domain-containing membrane protein YozV
LKTQASWYILKQACIISARRPARVRNTCLEDSQKFLVQALAKVNKMSSPEETAKTPQASAAEGAVSVHRAFVYGACGPGFGEIYAGARLRGYATLLLFLFFTVWFTWLLVGVMRIFVNRIFDSLSGTAPFVLPQISFAAVAISFFGIYFTWLWAMFSAVEAAVSRRRTEGLAAQAGVGWAAAIAWFCPGAGQVYTEERRFGLILFGVYLLGILLIVPAYLQMFQSLSELAKSGQLSTHDPFAVIRIVHELVTRVNYSFGKLFQDAIKYFSVAGTMAALRQGPLQTDTSWLKPSMAYGAGLVGLGWLCPGSGQLLQGRSRLGWIFFGAYFGSKLLIGLLLGQNLITVANADALAWIYVIMQWAAMAEAPLAMRRTDSGQESEGRGGRKEEGRRASG